MFKSRRKGGKSISCERIRQELLSAYIDGELSSEERELVEAHLSECEECARDLRTLRRTVELLGELPTLRVPRSFAIPVPAAKSITRLSRAYAFLRVATALAVLLLAIVWAGDVLFIGRAPSAPPPTVVLELEAERGVPFATGMVREKAVPPPVPAAPPTRERVSAAKPTTPQPVPQREFTRPWLGPGALRWIEIVLLFVTIVLSLTTVMVRRRTKSFRGE